MVEENDQLIDLSEPAVGGDFDNRQILLGVPIDKIQRVQSMTDTQYEEYTYEWVYGYLKKKYHSVRKRSGAGDLGRDIAAYIDDPRSDQPRWHNYQCKHYDHPLMPSDVYLELAKVIFYSYKGRYNPPEKYYFVAPMDCGPALSSLFDNAASLKRFLKENWERYCKSSITRAEIVPFEGEFEKYFDGFNFSIFQSIEPIKIIEQHAETRFHAVRFGGGLTKIRPQVMTPPIEVRDDEATYVARLLEVYSDYLSTLINSVSDLAHHRELKEHFDRQRICFYHAESLRNFARDSLPNDGNYSDLLEQFFHGLIDVVERDFPKALDRLREAIETAKKLQISTHALISVLKPQDRNGICHQLANDSQIHWLKNG